MKLPLLPSKTRLKGKKVFLRVDWNVPLAGGFAAEDSLKLELTVPTIKDLASRGAVVIVATHLGRPKGHDLKYSTKKLQHLVTVHYNLKLHFLGDELDKPAGLEAAQCTVKNAKPGTVLLLENVRFYPGEEKNDPKMAKALASLADLFVNDAFASCHRAHASVAGVAKFLPSYAGPNLLKEVAALERVVKKPNHPYLAFIGGAKISTKIGLINSLLKTADKLFISGAMATAFLAAKKFEIGKSYVEKEGIALAKKLLKDKRIMIPTDVIVAKKIEPGVHPRIAAADEVKKNEAIGDIGPQTLLAWAAEIKKAKTMVWNGPVGVSEIPAFSHGSLILARAIAAKSKGPAYGVVGGGNTLPVVLASGMSEWFDHISTGGGAMLEFIEKNGALPGLEALERRPTGSRTASKKKKL